MNSPQSVDVDIDNVFSSVGGVALSEDERLRFARQVLLGLAIITVGVLIAHGALPNNQGISGIFELIKIGVLPLVTLVVSFYFPNSGR